MHPAMRVLCGFEASWVVLCGGNSVAGVQQKAQFAMEKLSLVEELKMFHPISPLLKKVK